MSIETELELQRGIGRLEGAVNSLVHEVRTANARHTSVGAALSKRLTQVENKQTWLAGAGTVIGAILGLFVPTLFRK
jgi:hypothetical protein